MSYVQHPYSEWLHLRVREEDLDRVRALAERRGETISATVRSLLLGSLSMVE
jgi:hypothetical protein